MSEPTRPDQFVNEMGCLMTANTNREREAAHRAPMRGLRFPFTRPPQMSAGNDFVNPKPTLFLTREASKPCSRGQWGGALNATPHPPEDNVVYARA